MKEKIYIKELANLVSRSTNTIRQWERDKILPYSLMSYRDDNNYRYWTSQQAEGIKDWLKTSGRQPGHGLIKFRKNKHDKTK